MTLNLTRSFWENLLRTNRDTLLSIPPAGLSAMVLDQAAWPSAGADDSGFFSAEQPSTDTKINPFKDPVAYLRNYPTKVELPNYSPFRALLFDFSPPSICERYLARKVAERLDKRSFIVNRPLTQGETDSFVSQAVSINNFEGYGRIVGAAAAVPFAFPELYTQEALARFRFLNLLKSFYAKKTFGSYLVKGVFFAVMMTVGSSTLRSYREISCDMLMRSDSNLKGYWQDLRKMSTRVLSQRLEEYRRLQRALQMSQLPRPPPPSQRQPTSEVTDDASPTSGSGFDAYGYSQDNSGVSGQIMAQQDRYPRAQQQTQQQSRGTYTPTQAQRTSSEPSRSSSFDDDDFFGSTTSPSSSSSSQPRTGTTKPAQPAGSAWERLRNQAAQGSNQQATQSPWARQRQQQQQYPSQEQQVDFYGSSSSSGYGRGWGSTSSADNTMSSREKAQREFDKLLEAERNNRDGGSRKEKTW